MELTLYQIDTFTTEIFHGNPAAVCPLQTWIADARMQAIAAENNVSETAFFVAEDVGYRIRWFTPEAEVDLCGHATLASAFVLFNIHQLDVTELLFYSNSGPLKARRDGSWITLDFPSQPAKDCATPEALSQALGSKPEACLAAEDYIAVLSSADQLLRLQPDFRSLRQLDLRGVIVTAASTDADFILRFFAPKYGIDEDPVTGSAFTQLVPYWYKRLEKRRMIARQVSKRGGDVRLVYLDDRCLISGQAVIYMQAQIQLPD